MDSVIAETVRLLKEISPPSLLETQVEDLVVGVFFTGVKLSSGQSGVAFTPVGEIPEAVCCPTTAARMPQAGRLGRRPLSEYIGFALEGNVLKSAIGVAALNALSQALWDSGLGGDYPVVKGEDGFDLLDIRPGETVVLVGAFGPYIRRLKMMGNPFRVIEKNSETLRPEEMRYFRPAEQMASALAEADAVIVTGTAIVNHTIDAILAHARGKRTALIGPTASMLPGAFFARGVHLMAGVRILEPERMIEILKQGGSGYHLLRECAEKMNWIKN